MKRILYLNEVSEVGGIENSIYNIVSNLDKREYEAFILSPEGPSVKRWKESGITHLPFTFRMRRLKAQIPLTTKRIVNPVSLLQKFREGIRIAGYVRQYRFDLMHSHMLSPHVAGLIASKLTGVPLIWHIHYIMPSLLYRIALPDHIIFVSQYVARQAFPVNTFTQASVIYNGIQFSSQSEGQQTFGKVRNEFGIKKEQPLAAIIGMLSPIKGQLEVTKAWKEVVHTYPDAKLLIVGQPAPLVGDIYLKSIQDFIKNENLQESVILTGFRSDIPDILQAIDVYISFTNNDANSISVIEAMAAGKAIIGANSGGMPELISNGVSGVLVDNGDITGLAKAIVSLFADPSKRQELGIAARTKALEAFTLSQYVDRVKSIYEQLL
jgi:glycosyltransferase involved in cell wall biosynthesis